MPKILSVFLVISLVIFSVPPDSFAGGDGGGGGGGGGGDGGGGSGGGGSQSAADGAASGASSAGASTGSTGGQSGSQSAADGAASGASGQSGLGDTGAGMGEPGGPTGSVTGFGEKNNPEMGGSLAAQSQDKAISDVASFNDSLAGQIAGFFGFEATVTQDPTTGLFGTDLGFGIGLGGVIGSIVSFALGLPAAVSLAVSTAATAIGKAIGLGDIGSVSFGSVPGASSPQGSTQNSGTEVGFGTGLADPGIAGVNTDSASLSGGIGVGNDPGASTGSGTGVSVSPGSDGGSGSSVCSIPNIISATRVGGTAGKLFEYTVVAQGNPPITYRVDRPTLPDGVELVGDRLTGIIATNNSSGESRTVDYSIRLYAENACGIGTHTLFLTVYPYVNLTKGGSAIDISSIPPITNTDSVCPVIYNPVCGEDRKTYSSACVASGAGISVLSSGACSSPTVSLSLSNTSVPRGGSTEIRWTSENSSYCVVGGNWPVSQAYVFSVVRVGTSGTLSIPNIYEPKTYKLTCRNGDGASSETASVSVFVQ